MPAAARTALLSLALSAGLAVAAPAAQPAPAPHGPPADQRQRQCFHGRNITSWAAEGDRVINLRVGVNDVFRLELMTRCPDVRFNQSIAVVTRGGSNFICSGLDAEIVTRTSIGPRRCPVTNIRKLTREEVAALPPRARP